MSETGDVGGVLANVAAQVPVFINIFTAMANVVGLVLIARLLWFMVTLSRGQHGAQAIGPYKVFSTAIVAAALLSFGSTVSTLVETISGNHFNYSDIISYSHEAGNRFGKFSDVMTSLFTIVQALGLMGIFSGWMTLLKEGDGQSGGPGSTVSKALIHMIAGGLCVYISGTLQMLIDTGGIAGLM